VRWRTACSGRRSRASVRIIRDGSVAAVGLSALLLGYGAAGLLGNAIVGRFVDRRPGPLLITLTGLMALALAALVPVLGAAPTVPVALLWGRHVHRDPGGAAGRDPARGTPARDAASAV
jgi:hypothetical protein